MVTIKQCSVGGDGGFEACVHCSYSHSHVNETTEFGIYITGGVLRRSVKLCF